MQDKEKQPSRQEAFLDNQFKNLRNISAALFPIITFLAFRAQDIIPFIFGKEFKNVLPAQILIWSVVFIPIHDIFLRIAWFLGKKRHVLLTLPIGAVLFLILNYYLAVQRHSLTGLCAAILISLAVMFIATLLHLAKTGVKMPLYRSFEKPFVAVMAMMLVLHYSDTWPFTFILLASAAGYLLTLTILNVLEK